eukprot:gene5515-9332_t
MERTEETDLTSQETISVDEINIQKEEEKLPENSSEKKQVEKLQTPTTIYKLLGRSIDGTKIPPSMSIYSFMRVWVFSEIKEPTMQPIEESKFELPPVDYSQNIERYRPEVGVQQDEKKETKNTRNGKTNAALKMNLVNWAKNCKKQHKMNYDARKQKYFNRLLKIDEESTNPTNFE